MKLDWRARSLLIGGAVGMVFGLGAAYMYIRTAEEQGEVPVVRPGQAVNVGLALLSVLRQIAAWPVEEQGRR